MEASTMTPPTPRRSTRDRRPVEPLMYDSTASSPDGKRRISIQETAEAGSWAATPINSFKMRRLTKNHITPSSAVTTPSFVFPTPSIPTAKKNHVTPSSVQPKAHSRHTMAPALPTVVSRRRKHEQHGLATLAQRFHHIVTTSGSYDVDLPNVVEQLGIAKRRIYDVVNILEGAGLMERNANTYRWIPPVTPQGDVAGNQTVPHGGCLEIRKLQEEERQLDVWIQMNMEKVEKVESFITSQHLAPLLEEDSTALAIATPRKSILHLPHDLEQQHETGHHIFTLIPPETHDPRRCMPPKVFLLESGEPMRHLSLVPPLPLLEMCCSDFTFSAQNPFLHVWDDASEDAQSLLRGLARSQDVVIKTQCSFEAKNATHTFEMIKDNRAAMPATEVFSSMSHALVWDSHVMSHALLWDSNDAPHDDATKKAPQDSIIPHHHSWEEQMAEQLPMPTLLGESSSLVLCEGA